MPHILGLPCSGQISYGSVPMVISIDPPRHIQRGDHGYHIAEDTNNHRAPPFWCAATIVYHTFQQKATEKTKKTTVSDGFSYPKRASGSHPKVGKGSAWIITIFCTSIIPHPRSFVKPIFIKKRKPHRWSIRSTDLCTRRKGW